MLKHLKRNYMYYLCGNHCNLIIILQTEFKMNWLLICRASATRIYDKWISYCISFGLLVHILHHLSPRYCFGNPPKSWVFIAKTKVIGLKDQCQDTDNLKIQQRRLKHCLQLSLYLILKSAFLFLLSQQNHQRSALFNFCFKTFLVFKLRFALV